MNAITKEYLAEIIHRLVQPTIATHRSSKNNYFMQEGCPDITDAEMLDFIQTIPYFDERLKDFLVGNLEEETIIVSQNWEIEFFKKCRLWAESFEWLHGNDYFLSDAHISGIKKHIAFLTLPY